MASSNSTRITLYTHATPNGHPISIFLEELKVSYEAIALSLSTAETGKVHNHVKAPWFLSINPNGRIPAIVDNEKNFNVFETSAILLYLQAELDQSNKFGFDSKTHPKEYSEVLQWLFFAHGGIGPMLGQASHFLRFAPEKMLRLVYRFDIDLAKDYPNVKAWVDRIDARPAVQKGLQVPEAYPAYEARGG